MKTSIVITLIICGTVVASMPIVARWVGVQLADMGALCYLALAAIMVVSAIIGSIINIARRTTRGFEPVPAISAV